MALSGTSGNKGGLMPSATYYIHVRTQCGGAFSPWASPIAFTTLATASVDELDNRRALLQVYPNPASQKVNVSISIIPTVMR